MNNPLSNARHINESFKNYRARLKVVHKVVKAKLRGALAHTSARVGIIADKDWLPEHADAVLHGKLVRMGSQVVKGAGLLHLVRDKGTTYRRPEPKPMSKRDRRRAA